MDPGFLVGAQVAMCLVLLVGAGIFVHAHYQLMTADPGFETKQTLFVEMRQRDQSPGKSLNSAIEQRVTALPGVRSVGFAQAAPFLGQEWRLRWQVAPNEPPRRGFSGNDTPAGANPSVAVVSETGARMFWQGENPIGKRITAAGLTLEVVGVVRDASSTRFAPSDELVLILGAVALALATMGIYGVAAFAATRRTKELGIRMALEARQRHIIWEMLASNAKPLAGGLFVGLLLTLGASIVLAKVMERAPFTVNARDPIAYIAVSLLLTATAAVAVVVPARRAAAADPLQALRQD